MPAAIWTGRNATPEQTAADITAALCDELGLTAPPLAMTLPAESTGVPAGSLLPPRARFSGMPVPTHCFLYIDAQSPRPFELRASVLTGRSGIRRSLGLGHLLYAVPLEPTVTSIIELNTPGGATSARFEGAPATTDRLNQDAHLVDAARALTPTTAGPDRNHTWQVARRLAIEPLPESPEGSVLLVQTLHRPTTRAWSLCAAAVLDFADRVETVLG
ncbi:MULTISPECIES: hypothetical protein [Streptomyces]|uniref:hypothetical protein n=1 Tax=Streptomyces TaxID=1883 RepID=UPI001966B2BD|nr:MULTISPECIES: hypothetical protein [Streptomyces]QRX90592.1 hypothetical protein JNO44_06875 [Streptomyces noursei]UJB40523.1 hypothetical protein HRD51_06490 [Streptomyces sp. A1-5]